MPTATMNRFARYACASLLLILFVARAASAQVPHPSDVFGFTPGDDYKLATYSQMLDY